MNEDIFRLQDQCSVPIPKNDDLLRFYLSMLAATPFALIVHAFFRSHRPIFSASASMAGFEYKANEKKTRRR